MSGVKDLLELTQDIVEDVQFRDLPGELREAAGLPYAPYVHMTLSKPMALRLATAVEERVNGVDAAVRLDRALAELRAGQQTVMYSASARRLRVDYIDFVMRQLAAQVLWVLGTSVVLILAQHV